MMKIKCFGIVLLLFVALGFFASGWEPVQTISTHPDNVAGYDCMAQIAVDLSGNSYVVWEGRDGDDWEIYWIKVGPSGIPGTVQKISTHPDNVTRNDYFPQIAADLSGNSYVVWQGRDGDDQEIYWIKMSPSGIPGTVQKISTHPDNVTRNDRNPRIDTDPSGNSYIVWQGHDGQDWEIYWIKMSPSGIPGTVQKISTHPDNITRDDIDPNFRVDLSGTSYVTWGGFSEQGWDIYWVRVDASGSPGTVQKISTHPDNTGTVDCYPQIAVDLSGNSYVTWEGNNCEGIYWTKVSASGMLGTAIKVSSCSYNHRGGHPQPQIAVDLGGNSYIVWASIEGHTWEVYWAKIDGSGILEILTQISTHPSPNLHPSDNPNPQIGVDLSGNSYITWDGIEIFGGQEVYWLKVDSSGVLGDVTKISIHPDNITGDDFDPQIAVHPSGSSYVTWEGVGRTSWDIYLAVDITDSEGPLTSSIRASPGSTNCIPVVFITAVIDDLTTGSFTIQAAEFFIDIVGENGTGIPMAPRDGSFDSPTESVIAGIHVTGLPHGLHYLYVHGQDALGNWGPYQSASFSVLCPGVMGDSPKKINEQMRSLAQYHISESVNLSVEVEDLLSQAKAQGLDTSVCEELINMAEEFLATAQDYFKGENFIPANVYGLRAMETYEEAKKCLLEKLKSSKQETVK